MIPDGANWSDAAQAANSDALLDTFSTPAGALALAYLRKITTGRVLPPTATDAELRHLEGGRALVAIIDMRMHDARSRRAAGTEPQPGGTPARRRRPTARQPGAG